MAKARREPQISQKRTSPSSDAPAYAQKMWEDAQRQRKEQVFVNNDVPYARKNNRVHPNGEESVVTKRHDLAKNKNRNEQLDFWSSRYVYDQEKRAASRANRSSRNPQDVTSANVKQSKYIKTASKAIRSAMSGNKDTVPKSDRQSVRGPHMDNKESRTRSNGRKTIRPTKGIIK